MGRGKEKDQPTSNPVEAKKHRDEACGHLKNGNYERALSSLNKVSPSIRLEYSHRNRHPSYVFNAN